VTLDELAAQLDQLEQDLDRLDADLAQLAGDPPASPIKETATA